MTEAEKALQSMSQAFVRSYLARANSAGRLAHAYLLWGPETQERDQAAFNIARSLVCEKGPQEKGSPCEECTVCKSVKLGTYPGFISLPWEGSFLEIDSIRELGEKLSVSFRGRRAVFVPKLERLTLPAANSFLKILEEPWGETIYIMTSARPANLLPTILSRCHRLPLFAGEIRRQIPESNEILKLLSDPEQLKASDLLDRCGFLPGKDKREKLSSFIEVLLFELEKALGGGVCPDSVFWGAEKLALFEACEEVLQAAQDLQGNVNPELVAEGLVYTLLRLLDSSKNS